MILERNFVRHGLFATALALSFLIEPASAGRITCKEAKQWVDSHPEHVKNVSVARLSRVHIAYRREILGRLASDKKIELWNAHLDSFANELSDEQKARLAELRAKYLKPERFEKGTPNKDLPDLKTLAKVFGEKRARHMFHNIGTPDDYESDQLEIAKLVPKKKSAKANRKIASDPDTEDQGLGDPTEGGGSNPIGDCNCTLGDTNCPSGLQCKGWTPGELWPYTGCVKSNWGCGFLWLSPCNGICWQ